MRVSSYSEGLAVWRIEGHTIHQLRKASMLREGMLHSCYRVPYRCTAGEGLERNS